MAVMLGPGVPSMAATPGQGINFGGTINSMTDLQYILHYHHISWVILLIYELS